MSKQNNAASEAMGEAQKVYWAGRVLNGWMDLVTWNGPIVLVHSDVSAQVVEKLNSAADKPRDPRRFIAAKVNGNWYVVDTLHENYALNSASSCEPFVMAYFFTKEGEWQARRLCDLLNGIEPEPDQKPEPPKFKPGQIAKLTEDVIDRIGAGVKPGMQVLIVEEGTGNIGGDRCWRGIPVGCVESFNINEHCLELVPELNEPEVSE